MIECQWFCNPKGIVSCSPATVVRNELPWVASRIVFNPNGVVSPFNGRDRLIEVKTTRFGAMTPFFASRNEVGVSETREREYQLYRLFSFREQPKLFVLPGALRNTCELEPVSFSALPK